MTEDPESDDQVYSISGQETEDDDGYPLWYLDLSLRGRPKSVSAFSMTLPSPPDREFSYNFPLRRALPWLQLTIGEVAETTTVDEAFSVELERVSARHWRFDLDRIGQVPTLADAESAFLEIESSGVEPPWQRTSWSGEVNTPEGRYLFRFAFEFCSPMNEECTPRS